MAIVGVVFGGLKRNVALMRLMSQSASRSESSQKFGARGSADSLGLRAGVRFWIDATWGK